MKILIATAPLALLAACSGGASEDQAAGPDPVATVRTALATRGATSETVDAYGAAEAGPGSERAMAIQSEATLTRIVAPVGTAVRAGQVVAILKPSRTSELDLVRANSDAAVANAALARAIRLRKDGLVSDADVETARAAAQSANATRQSTAQRNGTLTLRAPTSGTVQNITAKPGDLIAAGTTVATIGGQGNLRARFGIDPSIASRVHAGQPITLSLINADTKLETSVSGVDPQVDATTRLASVYAHVPAGHGIGAGEPLRATISVNGTTEGVTIPYSALLDDGGKSFVFVVTKGTAKQVDVLPGSSSGDRIAITKGVKAGDRVVTEGGTALEDGMKVREDKSAGASK